MHGEVTPAKFECVYNAGLPTKPRFLELKDGLEIKSSR